MKINAMVAGAPGGPEVLKMSQVDLAWPRGDHDVLVDLRAAALNPADAYFRQYGGYLSEAPLVLGHDGMGVVRAVGAAVRDVAPGDRVAFCNGGIGGAALGTYAQAAVLPDWQLAKVPDAVDDLTAAALPLVAITCWEALYDRANLQPGEFALIHGGAGGTGHIAVQLAHLRGARVATTVSSDEKAKIVTDLGAERAINYRTSDFVEAAQEWSGGGVQVAFDNASAEVMQASYRAMAPYGRVVTLIGVAPDDADYTAYNQNLTLHAVMMLTPMWKGLEAHLREQAAIVRQTLALVAEGRLRVLHAATFALEEAAEAHRLLESGKAVGKITLRIG